MDLPEFNEGSCARISACSTVKLQVRTLRHSSSHSRISCHRYSSALKQPPIKSVEHYQVAWTACDAASDILTTLDDGSDAAVWCCALARPIFDFELDYLARHGHRPLNAGGPEVTDGPTGSA